MASRAFERWRPAHRFVFLRSLVPAPAPRRRSHAIPQFLGFAVLVACGVKAWIFDGGYIDVMATPHLRAASDYGELATTLQIPFQLYELVCAVCVKRLRGKSFELVLHHALALTLALLSARKGIYYFYGAYFMGVSEISSLPLAFVDAFKMFKQLKADYPKTNETVRPIFAVCFLILRTLYWPVVSYHFWRASLAHEGDALEVNTFLVVNVILSSLQAYWTKLIIEGLVKLLKGDPTADDVGKGN